MIKKYFKFGWRTIIMALLAILLTSHPLFAISGSDFKTMNGIDYFDESGTAKAASGACTASLPGENPVEQAFWYFTNKKIHSNDDVMNRKVAAAILGNLIVESGGGTIDPKSHQNGGGPGRGIAQWSVDGRWQDLLEFAAAQKRSEWDLSLQLDFMWHEMTEVNDFKSTIPGLKASNSIASATESFMLTFERPGVPHLDQRIQWANDTFGKYGTGSSPGVGGGSSAATCGDGSIVSIAQAELAKGVVEIPIGCDAGNPSVKGDCGPEVNKYTDSTLEYWCADFVSWVYKESGKPFTGGASGGWRIAAVSVVKAWFEKNGSYTPNGSGANPQPGDIYVYGEIKETEHIGIVEKVVGNDLYTISGNTSTESYDNGVGVGAKVYKNFRSNTYVRGFGGLR
jgi:hypothetical protein